MGLSIRFTDHAVQLPGPRTNGHLRQYEVFANYQLVRDTLVEKFPWNYPDLDRSLCGHEGYFVYGAEINRSPAHFDAEYSYTGWAMLREGLSRFFVGAPADVVRRNLESEPGRTPFYSLISFVDSEGLITPSAVRILASDFHLAQAKRGSGKSLQEQFMDHMKDEHGNYSDEAFLLLREGVYHAARSGGLIVFS